MINFAIRYRPILEILRHYQPQLVLEVGSGPEGLALFWPGRVVGLDLTFKRRPLHAALRASALTLPFAGRAWPLVVSCDMLEHIPPPQRWRAVSELTRVTGQTLLLAFPSGPAAAECYANLARRLPAPMPVWLAEHLHHGLPDVAPVITWLQEGGFSVQSTWYESARAHERLMGWETRKPVQLLTHGLTRLMGPWLASHWPVARDGPLLRALLIAERSSPARHETA